MQLRFAGVPPTAVNWQNCAAHARHRLTRTTVRSPPATKGSMFGHRSVSKSVAIELTRRGWLRIMGLNWYCACLGILPIYTAEAADLPQPGTASTRD
jgi:hypothetical protein